MNTVVNVGVLSIIGSFREHGNAIKLAFEAGQKAGKWKGLSLNVVKVKNKDQLKDDLHGLIIPGGESTVISAFLEKNGFFDALKKWIDADSKFTWGTCAGMILLSNEVIGGVKNVVNLGGIDITCQRNAFGRQNDSAQREFEIIEDKILLSLPDYQRSRKFLSTLIRAPAIAGINSEDVTVLSREIGECSHAYNTANAVQQGNKMATSFHPELTNELRWHAYFIEQVVERSSIVFTKE